VRFESVIADLTSPVHYHLPEEATACIPNILTLPSGIVIALAVRSWFPTAETWFSPG
jgi:hypothetical protein